MSKLLVTKFGEVLENKDGRKKFEYLVGRDADASDPVAVFSQAVRTAFCEFALEDLVDSDDPWCIIAVLHVYSRFAETLDDIQSTHRSHLVKKLNTIVDPLCSTETYNSSGSVFSTCFEDAAQISLLEWLMMIEYENTDTPESLARQWDFISTHPDESLSALSPKMGYAGVLDIGPISAWYLKPFDEMFSSGLDRKMFDFMVQAGGADVTDGMVACESVDALFVDFTLNRLVIPEEHWCLISMMSIFGAFGDSLTSRQEQHYLLLVAKLNRLVEPFCFQDTRNHPKSVSSPFSYNSMNNLLYWLSKIEIESTDTPSSLAAYWDRISGNVFQHVPNRFYPAEFNPEYGRRVKFSPMARVQSFR